MRRFRFRLEAVLRQRAAVQSLRLQELASAQQHLLAKEQELDRLLAERSRLLALPLEDAAAAERARRDVYLDLVCARIAGAEAARAEAAQRLDQARKALLLARQAREAIERIRDRDYREWQADCLRAEQAQIDELAGTRHAHPAI